MTKIMKIFKTLLATAALVVAAAGWAQAPLNVDYDAIKAVVEQKPEEYRALTARFMAGDTSLTPEELAVVYYGFPYTPNYNPDETYAEVMDAMAASDMTLAINLAEDALRRNPVSLAMLFKLYGCCATSDQPRMRDYAKNVQDRILMLGDLIAASGTGVRPDSPWKVISHSDADEFLNKYCYIAKEVERTELGDEIAVKVQFRDIPDDVIVYLDLTPARNHMRGKIKEKFNLKNKNKR